MLIAYFITFAIFVAGTSNAHDNVMRLKRSSDSGCLCQNYTCGCCAHLDVPKIGLNDTACVNLSYLPEEYGISFVMTIDDLTIYNETISAKNPPPVCFGAPVLKDYADICIHFTDLNFTLTKLHGCVQLEARLNKILVAKYKIGCFNIGQANLNKYVMKNAEIEGILESFKMSKAYSKLNEYGEDVQQKVMKMIYLSRKFPIGN